MGADVCVMWATFDVLMCTASIWHMCTMSMDRFFTLKYPMKYGRNKTKTTVVLKIMFVWVVSVGISCPLGIMGFIDHSNVYNEGACVPTISNFVILGSALAFYLPFIIMIITYVMTTKILCDNQRIMRSIAREHSDKAYQARKERNETLGAGFLSPHMYIQRLQSTRGSLETTASIATSVNESIVHNSLPTQTREEQKLIPPKVAEPPDINKQGLCGSDMVSEINKNDVINTSTTDLDKVSIKSNTSNFNGVFPVPLGNYNLSSSQPQLQISASPVPSPTLSQHSLLLPQPFTGSRTVSRASSYASYLGVFNTDPSLSRATSLNSMLSQANSSMCGSMVIGDFDDPELMEKLSQIEQEMDECLMQGQLRGEETLSDAGQSQTADVHSTASRPVSLTGSYHDNYSYCNDEKETNGNVTNEHVKGDVVTTTQNTSISNVPVSLHEDEYIDSAPNLESTTIPLANVTSPPVTSSDDTLEGSDSENTELVTIRLRASGCYLYKLSDKTKCSILLQRRHEQLNYESPSHKYNFTQHPSKQDSSDFSLDEDAASVSMSTSCSTRRYPPHKAKVNPRSLGFGSSWKALTIRKKKKMKAKQFIKLNGNALPPQVIPKRTASNEKKASKVLGIIFAVFVVLWTPFFIVNIISVVCQPCMQAMTPTLMAAIVWLGYMSSLANPIIYTMFNTAFRRAFYKILKCQYPMRRRGYSAAQTPDTIGMTNMSNYPSDSRRYTLTLSTK